MTRNRIIQLIAVLTLVAALLGAAMTVPPIVQLRQDLQLAGLGSEEDTSLPPMAMMAQVALATMRGVAVDIAWYRINQLKEEGKFFEINQLAQTITSLQPRFPQVWSFHAWNMAYNVSVMTHTPEERWDWVSKGIALLRDKGIPYNPRAIRLYRELGWIFFHKVGQFSDDVTWYYKVQLAREWQEILGAPSEGATKEQAVAAFAKIVNAPDTVNALKDASPAVGPLLAKLHEQGYSPDLTLLRRIGRVLMATYSTDATLLDLDSKLLSESDRKLAETLGDPALAPGVEPLLAHLRKRALIDHYHMKPDFMLEIMKLYGPLDWRHPAAHGAYWSSLGTEMARALCNTKDIDLINTYRGVIHAMQELMFRGRISFDPVSGSIDLLPDPRFIAAYEKAKDKAEEDILNSGIYGEKTTENFNAGHENFLLTAVVFSYLYGEPAQAQEYYDKVRQLYGRLPDNIRSGRYTQTLDGLVMQELSQNWELSAYSRQFIDGMLRQAFTQGLANTRMDIFNRFMGLAQEAYKGYEKQAASPVAMNVQERRAFLPWDELVAADYISTVRDANNSPMSLVPFRVWAATPDALRRVTFDRLKDPMRARATRAGFNPDRAFPEPPGMEAYRNAHPAPAETPTSTETPAPTNERK